MNSFSLYRLLIEYESLNMNVVVEVSPAGHLRFKGGQ
jgi:hypothetical protein